MPESTSKSRFYYRDQLSDNAQTVKLCKLLQNNPEDYQCTRTEICTMVANIPPSAPLGLAEMGATHVFVPEFNMYKVRLPRSKWFFDPVAVVPYLMLSLALCALYYLCRYAGISALKWFEEQRY